MRGCIGLDIVKRELVSMVKWIPVFLFFLGIISVSAGVTDPVVFTYKTDRGVDARIHLAYAEDKLPDYYYCDLNTPICLENLCNPVEIRLEWDLLGNFRNYREVLGKEITKFDHEPFEPEDHAQLKAILGDRESMLRDYMMEDLVDTTKKVYSAEIDGMTAATSSTFSDKLVGGAIYTCYTLWHIINGEIADRIFSHTRGVMSLELKRKMLTSGLTVYQDYVINGLKPNEKEAFSSELFGLIGGENRFIAIKAIKSLPENRLIMDPLKELVRKFKVLPLPIQSAVVQFFQNRPCEALLLDEWVSIIGDVTDQHKNGVYKIFELNRARLSRTAIDKLSRFISDKKEQADGSDRRLLTLLKQD